MKVILKTLNNKKYELDVEGDQTIASVKEAANAKFSFGEPESLKLIHTGKVLKNDQTVADTKIKEGGFIVVMVSKKKPAPPASSSAAPSASPASAAANAAPSASTDSVPAAASASPAPPAASSASPAQASPPVAAAPASSEPASGDSALVRGAQYEQTVERLMALGFERPQVVRALQASFNNPDRAAEYLFSGIPDNVFPAASQPSQQGAPAASGGDANVAAAAASAASAPSAGGDQSVPVDPAQIQQVQALLQARPDLVEAIIAQIAQTHPQVMQVIGQNRESLVQMLRDPVGLSHLISSGVLGVPGVGGAGGAGGAGFGDDQGAQPHVIHITEEDRQSIERLEALGFSRNRALEAYLACDRNEELAANYLFDSGFEDNSGDN